VSGFDLIVRGARAIIGSGATLDSGDIGIVDGRIAAISHSLAADGAVEIDATGLAARRFRLPCKGTLEPGADADLALVALGEPRTLAAEQLCSRHKRSPYVGRTFTARIVHTLLRGRPVAVNDVPRGRLQKPSR
jgi:dihydroorotase-like cyclic amidohydrolase